MSAAVSSSYPRRSDSSGKPAVVAEPVAVYSQPELLSAGYPLRASEYPKIRYMGSKSRLLPWIFTVLSDYEFDSVLDAFSGSGCVSYLFKSMDKQVWSNDFLNLGATIAQAAVSNSSVRLTAADMSRLKRRDRRTQDFIERTFSGIFFTPEDLRFLDAVWGNIRVMRSKNKKSLALAALIRSCAKRQPRGVFTIAGDPERYKDGRRDLKLSIEEHFDEQALVYSDAVFDNGRDNHAKHGDVYEWTGPQPDLVYMDPPYVPRADDNCYMKRYHFLEGLSCYWEGQSIMENTRVKKIEKPFTPFSYRRTALEAFDALFSKFSSSTLVLSYSSNGFPDLPTLVDIMRGYKGRVRVCSKPHRYHFGTHKSVTRSLVDEYLIVGE